MSVRKLYHGSMNRIEQPLFGYGKSYNDYGLGFYCTESQDMAREWAVGKEQNGYANSYDLECDSLNILNLDDDRYCVLHWLTILLENRKFDVPSALAWEAKRYLQKEFRVDYESYDAIIGYRADDSYFSFAQDFINGAISYRQLSKAMRLGKLGQQFVLKSEKAFSKMRYTGAEPVSYKEWYAKKMLRDKVARRDYFDMNCGGWQRGELYITQILDEEMREDDARLR